MDVNATASAPHVSSGSDEAVAAPAPRVGLLSQPSTWSALWALGALLLLAVLRGTLSKLT